VAKCRLTTGSSTKGQRCSAGCSSGLGGGRKTRLIPSGTARPSGPCQPALSSTRMIWRSRPAPVCRAKPASSASKKGLERPLQRYQTVSPLVGWTKATTCSHWKRWWPSAIGRWPTGAQTRRRTGFRPRRCSSSAQTSTGRSGCSAAALRDRLVQLFFSASRCSGPAERGCRGRGAWTDPALLPARAPRPFPGADRAALHTIKARAAGCSAAMLPPWQRSAARGRGGGRVAGWS
jgi:hypothetical protein